MARVPMDEEKVASCRALAANVATDVQRYIDGHTSVGVEQVRIDKATGYIRVDTPGSLNGVPLVTGDETAAANGMIFGASGGNSYISIKCYKVGTGLLSFGVQADYDVIASVNLNLWIAWLSPLVRGVGDPSASERIADLEARVLALEGG